MTGDVSQDQFALIKIEGMHCHKCEQSIQKSLLRNPGVHEVEVDFASGQASVLFDPSAVSVPQLLESVKEAGYRPTGFSQGQTDRARP
ncbi:MAG TPA: heavy metal-associated domain-containing protein [Tepidisphaeraceae bacterium]|nr:heavy metal-associated domain-containing protein [Tepidisphaeraceae bacterium]